MKSLPEIKKANPPKTKGCRSTAPQMRAPSDKASTLLGPDAPCILEAGHSGFCTSKRLGPRKFVQTQEEWDRIHGSQYQAEEKAQAEMYAARRRELWTLSKPITLQVAPFGEDQPVGHRAYQTDTAVLLVQADYDRADERGMIQVAVVGYVPWKDERATLYDFGKSGPQTVTLRESLIQSIQQRPDAKE